MTEEEEESPSEEPMLQVETVKKGKYFMIALNLHVNIPYLWIDNVTKAIGDMGVKDYRKDKKRLNEYNKLYKQLLNKFNKSDQNVKILEEQMKDTIRDYKTIIANLTRSMKEYNILKEEWRRMQRKRKGREGDRGGRGKKKRKIEGKLGAPLDEYPGIAELREKLADLRIRRDANKDQMERIHKERKIAKIKYTESKLALDKLQLVREPLHSIMDKYERYVLNGTVVDAINDRFEDPRFKQLFSKPVMKYIFEQREELIPWGFIPNEIQCKLITVSKPQGIKVYVLKVLIPLMFKKTVITTQKKHLYETKEYFAEISESKTGRMFARMYENRTNFPAYNFIRDNWILIDQEGKPTAEFEEMISNYEVSIIIILRLIFGKGIDLGNVNYQLSEGNITNELQLFYASLRNPRIYYFFYSKGSHSFNSTSNLGFADAAGTNLIIDMVKKFMVKNTHTFYSETMISTIAAGYTLMARRGELTQGESQQKYNDITRYQLAAPDNMKLWFSLMNHFKSMFAVLNDLTPSETGLVVLEPEQKIYDPPGTLVENFNYFTKKVIVFNLFIANKFSENSYRLTADNPGQKTPTLLATYSTNIKKYKIKNIRELKEHIYFRYMYNPPTDEKQLFTIENVKFTNEIMTRPKRGGKEGELEEIPVNYAERIITYNGKEYKPKMFTLDHAKSGSTGSLFRTIIEDIIMESAKKGYNPFYNNAERILKLLSTHKEGKYSKMKFRSLNPLVRRPTDEYSISFGNKKFRISHYTLDGYRYLFSNGIGNKLCTNCGNNVEKWKCFGCLDVGYCGRKCQEEHWNKGTHNKECSYEHIHTQTKALLNNCTKGKNKEY